MAEDIAELDRQICDMYLLEAHVRSFAPGWADCLLRVIDDRELRREKLERQLPDLPLEIVPGHIFFPEVTSP